MHEFYKATYPGEIQQGGGWGEKLSVPDGKPQEPVRNSMNTQM
jgi:hypothetical protein